MDRGKPNQLSDYCREASEAFREYHRVLSPNGRLLDRELAFRPDLGYQIKGRLPLAGSRN